MELAANSGPAYLPAREGRGFILLLGVLVLVAAGKAVLYDSMDPDLFWHLCVGKQLWAQVWPGLHLPHPLVDNLSFSSQREPWTPYSWLAEIVMYKLWDVGTYRFGVLCQALLASIMVVFTALGALEMTIAKHGRPRYLPSILSALTGEFLSLPFISYRPVTFAMAMLAITAYLLQRDRRWQECTRAIWLLIPLTILTTNIHLFAFFIPASVLALFVGAVYEYHREQNADRRRRAIRLCVLLVGVSLGYLATPMLPGVLRSIVGYQFKDVMVNSNFIVEMRPFWWGGMGKVAVVFVVAVLASTLSNPRVLRAGEWLWLAGSVVVLLRLGRFSPIFAIFAAPMLACTAPKLSDRPLGKMPIQAMCLGILLIGGIKIAAAFPRRGVTLSDWLERLGPDFPGYPTQSADYVASNVTPTTHHVIGEFTWGGYLEYRFTPRYQIFMDGRSQVFAPEFWNAIYLGTPASRKQYLSTVSADVAVLPIKGSAFADDLQSLGWHVIHTDARAQVMLPPAAK